MCGRSTSVSFTDTAVPKQMVTALTGNPEEMRVTWNSNSATGAVLRYGLDGDAKVHTITPNTTTYTKDDLCGAPATTQGWHEPGYFHTAIIKVCLVKNEGVCMCVCVCVSVRESVCVSERGRESVCVCVGGGGCVM